jgi:hypothetical protein
MQDFSDEINSGDWDDEIHDNYGYNYHQACFGCIEEIREDIARQRDDQKYQDWEMDYKLHI